MESGLWNPDGTRRDESVLSELLGVSFKELHREYSQNTWAAYLTPKNGFSFHGLLSCTTAPVSSVFSEVQCTKAHEIAEFILPSVACDFQHWVNWWSPPPGDPSGYPAITLNKYGNGHVLYTAFDYFTMAAEETYEDTDLLFQDFFNALDFIPRIQNKTPYSHVIRTAFSRQGDHYLAHQISSIPHLCKGEAPPISGGELVIQGKISSAFLVYPRKENLSFRYDGKVSVISLPDFSMQQIVSFKVCE